MKKFVFIMLCVSNAVLFPGFMFKAMHWPGGSISIVLGMMLTMLSVTVYAIYRYMFKDKLDIKRETYGVYFSGFIVLSGLLFFNAMGASRDYLDSNLKANARLENSNEKLLALIEKHEIDDSKIVVSESIQKTYDYVSHLKSEMITQSGGTDDNGFPLAKDNTDIAAITVLFLEKGQLDIEVESLRQLMMEHFNEEELIGLNIGSYTDENGFEYSFASGMTEYMPLSMVLMNLTAFQSQLLSYQLQLLKKH